MRCVVKGMYKADSISAVLLDGEKSNMFNVEQGVAQAHPINDLLQKVEGQN